MRIPLLVAMFVSAGCLAPLPEAERGQQPDAGITADAPDPQAWRRVLEEWSGCMTLANFQAANMASAWGNLTGNDLRLCRNCHDEGQFGFIASLDEEDFFTRLSQHASLLLMYFRVDVTTNTVVINTTAFQAANRKPGHPGFNALDNPGMTALEAFHAATTANSACGSPTLID